jgi:hypothetical protein
LPARLADRYADCPLVFSDASRLRHGGLAVVLFAEAGSEPLVGLRYFGPDVHASLPKMGDYKKK